MLNIAVAGGTSPTLGKALVNALRASRAGHRIIILSSRRVIDQQPTADISIRTVDYADVSNLYYALSDVDILISVLKIPGPEWVTYQMNLLRAAITAGVKRFAPSEFELGPAADGAVDVLAGKLVVWEACRTAMEMGEIACARFSCGMFMNYLGLGSQWGAEATHGLEDGPMIWDVEHMTAEVPMKSGGYNDGHGAGHGPGAMVTLTEIGDVGRFVAAACELPSWPADGELGMYGEVVRADAVVAAIERVRGWPMTGVTWAERTDYLERAEHVEGIGRDPSEIRAKMVAQILVAACEGRAIVQGRLNELCPSVRPVDLEEYLVRAWGSRWSG